MASDDMMRAVRMKKAARTKTKYMMRLMMFLVVSFGYFSIESLSVCAVSNRFASAAAYDGQDKLCVSATIRRNKPKANNIQLMVWNNITRHQKVKCVVRENREQIYFKVDASQFIPNPHRESETEF